MAACLVFAIRDLWPIALAGQQPKDGYLGWITWTRLALVAYIGLIVPIVRPGVYIPVDPEVRYTLYTHIIILIQTCSLQYPMPPNEEQLSSLFSTYMFSFIDPIIIKAGKHAHLPYEELPLLGDDDQSAYLKKSTFPRLDPTVRKSEKHIIWVIFGFFGKSIERIDRFDE